jgi:hypothetical protein
MLTKNNDELISKFNELKISSIDFIVQRQNEKAYMKYYEIVHLINADEWKRNFLHDTQHFKHPDSQVADIMDVTNNLKMYVRFDNDKFAMSDMLKRIHYVEIPQGMAQKLPTSTYFLTYKHATKFLFVDKKIYARLSSLMYANDEHIIASKIYSQNNIQNLVVISNKLSLYFMKINNGVLQKDAPTIKYSYGKYALTKEYIDITKVFFTDGIDVTDKKIYEHLVNGLRNSFETHQINITSKSI